MDHWTVAVIQVWRKTLLLKYIGLPIPSFFPPKSRFNFSSDSSLLVLCLSAVAGCSSLLSRMKPLAKGWFQLAPVSWPSCRQQASPAVHARAWKSCLPLSVTNSSFIPNSGPPVPYFSKYKRPSLLIPAPLALTKIIKTVCPLYG